jgi:FkbM family methyltransferase
LENIDSWSFSSQLFEDKLLLKEFFWNKEKGAVENGIFVEVGALDGIEYSNTLVFERYLNWTGVLIEGCPSSAAKLVKNRLKTINFAKAICPATQSPRIVNFTEQCGPSSGIPGNSGDKFMELSHNHAAVIPVNCAPMSEILFEANVKNVDLLSVDVEGFELPLLQSIDFHAVHVGVIIIEVNHNNPLELIEIRKHLISNDFISTGLCCQHYGDEIWVNRKRREHSYVQVDWINADDAVKNIWRLKPCEIAPEHRMKEMIDRDNKEEATEFAPYVRSFAKKKCHETTHGI